MSIPSDLLYSKDHEWIRVENGVATCGITAFAVAQLEEVIYVSYIADDDSLSVRDPVAEVESTKAVSEVYAPVSGELVESNETLEDDAETINSDPYRTGWLFKILLEDEEELDGLMSAAEYAKHIAEEADH
jgi:glycine cleavage system H protein